MANKSSTIPSLLMSRVALFLGNHVCKPVLQKVAALLSIPPVVERTRGVKKNTPCLMSLTCWLTHSFLLAHVSYWLWCRKQIGGVETLYHTKRDNVLPDDFAVRSAAVKFVQSVHLYIIK